MRVGIDARLNAYRQGGIPQYTRQLLTALAPQVAADHARDTLGIRRHDELIALQHIRQRTPLLQDALVRGMIRHASLVTPPHHRYEQWTLPLELLRYQLDVLHTPDFIVPRYAGCRKVVTIHDLAFLHYPEIVDEAARNYYGQVYDSVRQADAIIAVSQTTRDDICELLDMLPGQVDVVYEAAAPMFCPMDIPEGEMRQVGQGLDGSLPPPMLQVGRFGLFVSTLEPRKNLPTLLQALYVCQNRRRGETYQLVIAGGRGWYDDSIFSAVRDLALGDVVVFTGQVTMDELLWLYRACRFYANPSLYEGFGLPVVEALACGSPTLVSDGGSLAEIAGDAALVLPPQEVQAWADSIEQVWTDDDLHADLRRRGPSQAARFSWQKAAEETLTIYRRVAVHRGM